MAGIHELWADEKTDEYFETDIIVTIVANKIIEQAHNTKKRMPVILNEDLAWEWLFGNLCGQRISEIATTQSP
jgi:putative SOS response-associated peptidase YedK